MTVMNSTFASNGKTCHEHDSACNIIRVHPWLDHERPIRLEAAGIASLLGINRRIADVNLSTRDIVFASVKGGRFR